MCTHFLHHIHHLSSFPHHFPSPNGTNPPTPWAGPILPSCSPIL
jgi:hypothetical protein